MTNFYGKRIELLKLFGQKSFGDCSPGRVTGDKIFHAPGVLVDRSSTPNHIYVADTGNNRILGFRSYNSPKADIVFGQPDEFSGAPNGDCNTGMYGEPRRDSLCLLGVPMNPNLGEQWMRLNFDVDSEGNLYVPDFYNNRVLVYRAPFSEDKTDGKGDNLPDLVLGQPDYTSNGINRGQGPKVRDRESLYISFGGLDHVSSRGVSVDPNGNVWVADTFNYRILRFPKGSTRADLVLGQPNFSSGETEIEKSPQTARLDRMATPTLARLHPITGELYVIDEYPGGFRARVLIFRPPFRNGMAAARAVFPQQELAGSYAAGYQLSHATGLVFPPFRRDDPDMREGLFWLHDGGPNGEGNRMILLDKAGRILKVIGAPDKITFGGQFLTYTQVGMDPAEPFNLLTPGGMAGFDSDGNVYLADEFWHRVARYAMPYRVGKTDGGLPILPETNGGLFPNNLSIDIGPFPNNLGPAHCSGPGVGAITFQGQLIVRDTRRYMVWNDYLNKRNGARADVIVGQPTGTDITQENFIYGWGNHTIDHRNRLWTNSAHGRLMVYQLPLTGAEPLGQLISLYWADTGDELTQFYLGHPVAFEPCTQRLWVFDQQNHRLLRVKNIDDPQGHLLVDAVIGQKNKTDGAINRGMDHPDAASFGDVNNIKFDRRGNLFVVDNTYELHHNGRIITFLAEDLHAIDRMFPAIRAKRVYVAGDFDEHVHDRHFPPGEHPKSPVSVAFNSRNEMVVGNDGYLYDHSRDPRTRHFNQLYLYRNPLAKVTPDAVIELPMGAPGEISFDECDNLVVQDHIWSKVWIINYDRDPEWLRHLS